MTPFCKFWVVYPILGTDEATDFKHGT